VDSKYTVKGKKKNWSPIWDKSELLKPERSIFSISISTARPFEKL